MFPMCFAFSESLFQDNPLIEGNTHFQNRLCDNTVGEVMFGGVIICSRNVIELVVHRQIQ